MPVFLLVRSSPTTLHATPCADILHLSRCLQGLPPLRYSAGVRLLIHGWFNTASCTVAAFLTCAPDSFLPVSFYSPSLLAPTGCPYRGCVGHCSFAGRTGPRVAPHERYFAAPGDIPTHLPTKHRLRWTYFGWTRAHRTRGARRYRAAHRRAFPYHYSSFACGLPPSRLTRFGSSRGCILYCLDLTMDNFRLRGRVWAPLPHTVFGNFSMRATGWPWLFVFRILRARLRTLLPLYRPLCTHNFLTFRIARRYNDAIFWFHISPPCRTFLHALHARTFTTRRALAPDSPFTLSLRLLFHHRTPHLPAYL